LYGYETSYINRRTRIDGAENRVLRKVFGPEQEEVPRGCRKYYMVRSSIICNLHHVILGCTSQAG
jgi:hypothetical protein